MSLQLVQARNVTFIVGVHELKVDTKEIKTVLRCLLSLKYIFVMTRYVCRLRKIYSVLPKYFFPEIDKIVFILTTFILKYFIVMLFL